MSFESLGLNEALLRAVRARGYETPTPIQRQAIPVVLAGDDLMAAAQTGTGKTAGFTLPLLQLLSAVPGERRREPRCLVLVPTRELAAQVAESVEIYGRNTPLRAAVVFGGVNIRPQISQLRHGVDILVATPGRLLDLHSQGAVDLSHIQILVLDEADRMLDMGFIVDLKRILALMPPRRQNLLFSATFSPEIRRLAGNFLTDPVQIDVSPAATAAETVQQFMVRVEKDHKAQLLSYMIRESDWQQVLIFCRTKHGANRLAKRLDRDGIHSMAIHGNKSQAARTKALAHFKEGGLRALVATDLAARGLDIQQLPRVINYELPNVPEDYVHRIGRTGRAGMTGQALSLVSNDELKFLRDIEHLIGQRLVPEIIDGFAPGQPEIEEERPPRPQGRRAGSAPASRPTRSDEHHGRDGDATRAPRPESRPAASARPEGRPAGGRPAGGRPAGGRPAGRPAGEGRPGARSGGGYDSRPSGGRPSGRPESGSTRQEGRGSRAEGRPDGRGATGGRPDNRGGSAGRPDSRGGSGGRPDFRGSSGGRPEGRGAGAGRPEGRPAGGGRPDGRGAGGARPEGRSGGGTSRPSGGSLSWKDNPNRRTKPSGGGSAGAPPRRDDAGRPGSSERRPGSSQPPRGRSGGGEGGSRSGSGSGRGARPSSPGSAPRGRRGPRD